MPPTHNINHSGDIGLRRFGIFNQGHFYLEKKRPENRYGSYCQPLGVMVKEHFIIVRSMDY